MSSVAEVQRQQQVAKKAYERGEITKKQYAQFMVYSNAQLQRIKGARVKQVREAKAMTPVGYKLSKVETYVPAPLPPSLEQRAEGVVPTPKSPAREVTEYTYEPKTYEASTELFGPKKEWYDPATGELKQELTTKQGEKVLVSVYSRSPTAVKGASYAESQAMTGLGLTTVVASGVSSSALAAFGLGGVGAAEGAKFLVTGEHLTPSEAVSAAAAGQLIGLGVMSASKALQPRVQRSLDASYRQAVENQRLFKPSFTQKLGMKVTGAKTPSLAQEVVGAGEPQPVSMAMLKSGKVTGAGEDYFFDMPTPKSAQVYVRGYPATKSWVETTLVKRVYLEGLFTTVVPQKLLIDVETTVKPKIPYIPSEPAITRALSITPTPLQAGLLLPSAMALERTSQRVQQAVSVRQKQKQLTRTLQRQELLQRTIQEQSSSQSQRVLQEQQQAQSQKQALAQVQSQKVEAALIQKQKTLTNTPLLMKPTGKFNLGPALAAFGGSGGGAQPSGGFSVGKWFKKRNPVATWQQNLKVVAGVTVKSKKRKRQKKKRKKR